MLLFVALSLRCFRRSAAGPRHAGRSVPMPASRPIARRRRATKRAGAARLRGAQKLNELPAADVYSAVYRRIGRLRSADHRPIWSCGALDSPDKPKGGIGMSRAISAFIRDHLLRDLLRDLPLPDRLRRRPSLRADDRRRRPASPLPRGGRHRCRADRPVRLPAQRHGPAGVQGGWTRIVPPAVERSVYVLVASIALMILFIVWRPIDMIVWRLRRPRLARTSSCGYVLGRLGDRSAQHLPDQPFRAVRPSTGVVQRARPRGRTRRSSASRCSTDGSAHPLYLGFFLAFWATPRDDRRSPAARSRRSVYMLIAIRYEERDLTDLFGDDYRGLPQGVGMLTPLQAAERLSLPELPRLRSRAEAHRGAESSGAAGDMSGLAAIEQVAAEPGIAGEQVEP